jgi:hypothetical protein
VVRGLLVIAVLCRVVRTGLTPFRLVPVVVLIAASPGPAAAQAPQREAADATFNTRLLGMCRTDTAGYRITIDSPQGKALTPREVMTWTNPVRDGQLGVVHCWTDEGRIRAVSSVFNGPLERGQVQIMHEFASLAVTGIRASRDGTTHWDVSKPGATFQVIGKAPAPHETRAGRLRQIRSLAREFSGSSVSPYADKGRWELRMLPQPLYRYDATPEGGPLGEALDGALFAFVSDAGTDPELLLVIEARRKGEDDRDAGDWRWTFGAARFSDNSLFLKRDDAVVWEFVNRDARPDFAAGPQDIYRLRTDRLMPAADLRAPEGPPSP